MDFGFNFLFLNCLDITEILLKVALNTIALTLSPIFDSIRLRAGGPSHIILPVHEMRYSFFCCR